MLFHTGSLQKAANKRKQSTIGWVPEFDLVIHLAWVRFRVAHTYSKFMGAPSLGFMPT